MKKKQIFVHLEQVISEENLKGTLERERASNEHRRNRLLFLFK